MASTSRAVMSPRTMSIRLSRVTKSVVQTVGTALPEFNPIWFEPITAPVRRQRNRLAGEAFGHFCHSRVENAPTVEHLALTRRPCAQLASGRSRTKVSQRFFARGFLHFPADANLPVEFDPVKPQCRVRIGLQLLSFLALVIGKENEPVLVETFQQHNPH